MSTRLCYCFTHPLLQMLQPPGVDLQRHLVARLAVAAGGVAAAAAGPAGMRRRQRRFQCGTIGVGGELEQREAADALVLAALALWRSA